MASVSAGLAALDVVTNPQIRLQQVRDQPFGQDVERFSVDPGISGCGNAEVDDVFDELMVFILVRGELGVFDRLHERFFGAEVRPGILEQIGKDVVERFRVRGIILLAAIDQLVADADQFLMMTIDFVNADGERIAPA